jgi:ribonucleoside-diphosphate reductase subunit M1
MDHVDPVAITQKVISGVYGGVTTVQLDDLVSPPLAVTISIPANQNLYRPLRLLLT